MVDVREYEQYTIRIDRQNEKDIYVIITPKPNFDPSINFKIDMSSDRGFVQSTILRGVDIKKHDSCWSRLESADPMDGVYVIISQVIHEEINKIEPPIQKSKWKIKKEKVINFCVKNILYLRRYLLWQK